MNLAQLNKAITTLLNKQRKKSWEQSDNEVVFSYIEQIRAWLNNLEEEFYDRGI